jgi:hypothetical protein
MVINDIRQWLSTFLLSTGISEAREFLDLARSCIQYLDLYQHYFPAEFERSMQRNQRHELIPLPGDPYTVFEWQFLKLVNKHFFEIPYWVFDDPGAENRCYEVPIEPNGLPSIYEYGDAWGTAEDMDLGWQLLLYLGNHLPADFFDELLDDEDPTRAIFALPIEKGQVNGELLRAWCAEREEPLALFSYAKAVLDHDTGTAWLDATSDMPIDDATWDRDTVDELIRQWQEGEETLEKASQFIRWLEEDVPTHFQEVVTLWNLCMRETNNKKREE